MHLSPNDDFLSASEMKIRRLGLEFYDIWLQSVDKDS